MCSTNIPAPQLTEEQLFEMERRYWRAATEGVGFSVTYVDGDGNLVVKEIPPSDVFVSGERPR